MTTIKEFKEWLNNFPDETVVKVGIQQKASSYQSYGAVHFTSPDFEGDDCGIGWDFIDLRKNKNICYLILGESC